MKQIALFLASSVALLTLPAFAQRAPAPAFRAPAMHRPPASGAQVGQHPPGWRHHRGLNNFGGGWPVFMAPPGVAPAPSAEVVTHEFIDPRLYGPRPPSVEILSDKPLVFREPPHIIQLKRGKKRPPIVVVRRGVVSRE